MNDDRRRRPCRADQRRREPEQPRQAIGDAGDGLPSARTLRSAFVRCRRSARPSPRPGLPARAGRRAAPRARRSAPTRRRDRLVGDVGLGASVSAIFEAQSSPRTTSVVPPAPSSMATRTGSASARRSRSSLNRCRGSSSDRDGAAQQPEPAAVKVDSAARPRLRGSRSHARWSRRRGGRGARDPSPPSTGGAPPCRRGLRRRLRGGEHEGGDAGEAERGREPAMHVAESALADDAGAGEPIEEGRGDLHDIAPKPNQESDSGARAQRAGSGREGHSAAPPPRRSPARRPSATTSSNACSVVT